MTTSHSPVCLADLTTLRIGGSIGHYIRCSSYDEALAALRQTRHCADFLVLGGGSNLVAADTGFPGTVVHLSGGRTVIHDVESDGGSRPYVSLDAGVVWDDAVAATVAAGYGGLECLSGIPGSSGATPVQNVGAYGVEVDQVLKRVCIFDRVTGQVSWHLPESLELSYRSSILKRQSTKIVVKVEFWLNRRGQSQPIRYRELAERLGVRVGDVCVASTVREAVLTLRSSKGMVLDPADADTWSVGSFFTNPVVSEAIAAEVFVRAEEEKPGVVVPRYPAGPGMVKLSAAWLIDHAGFSRGYPGADARARISTKHTLALTNRGGASAADVVALARQVRDGVHARFGVQLHPEPVCLGITI